MLAIVEACAAGVQYNVHKYNATIEAYLQKIADCNRTIILCERLLMQKIERTEANSFTRLLQLKFKHSIATIGIVMSETAETFASQYEQTFVGNGKYMIGVKMDVLDILQRGYRHNEGVSR